MQPTENNVVDKKENTSTENSIPQETVKNQSTDTESVEQINWRKFRQQREEERKQREEIEKRAKAKEEEASALKAAMEALLNKPNQRHTDPEENEESDDDRIQKRIDAAILAREKKYEEERKQREAQEFPQRLASNYKDFNQVCSTENLDYLEYHYPEIAKAYKHMPDGYDKWESVYKAVKRFLPNPESKKDEKKAEKNFNKPQSMSSASKTQIGDSAPVLLDDQRRKDNWNRMQKIMRGA